MSEDNIRLCGYCTTWSKYKIIYKDTVLDECGNCIYDHIEYECEHCGYIEECQDYY